MSKEVLSFIHPESSDHEFWGPPSSSIMGEGGKSPVCLFLHPLACLLVCVRAKWQPTQVRGPGVKKKNAGRDCTRAWMSFRQWGSKRHCQADGGRENVFSDEQFLWQLQHTILSKVLINKGLLNLSYICLNAEGRKIAPGCWGRQHCVCMFF